MICTSSRRWQQVKGEGAVQAPCHACVGGSRLPMRDIAWHMQVFNIMLPGSKDIVTHFTCQAWMEPNPCSHRQGRQQKNLSKRYTGKVHLLRTPVLNKVDYLCHIAEGVQVLQLLCRGILQQLARQWLRLRSTSIWDVAPLLPSLVGYLLRGPQLNTLCGLCQPTFYCELSLCSRNLASAKAKKSFPDLYGAVLWG